MTRRGALLFAAMCVIWGVPYLLIRVAVRELSPAVLVCGRTAIALALLAPLALRRGELRTAAARWRPVLAFAAVEIAIPWWCLSQAERHLTSSLSALLIAGVPLVSVVIAATTGARERPRATNLAGLLLGTVGVVALVGFDTGSAGALPLAEVAVVVVCYALGPAILARFLPDAPPLGVLTLALGAAFLANLPAAAVGLPARVPGWRVLGSLVGLGVVCTALAFVLFVALIAEIGPVRSMVITYVNPAVASALGVAVLGEPFTAGMGLGFVLVLAGSTLATRAGDAPSLRARLSAAGPGRS